MAIIDSVAGFDALRCAISGCRNTKLSGAVPVVAKGKIGEGVAALMGAMLVSRMGLTALSRTDTPEENRPRFAIITTAADAFMQPIHSRMPVILDRDEERAWIERGGELSDFLRLLETPYPPALRAYEVSREVNRATVDTPEVMNPV